MRNAHLQPGPSARAASAIGAPGFAQPRRTADATSLLLELARALRGYASFVEQPQRRRALAERAHQAVTAELARSGPIDLALRGETFALAELSERFDARGGLAILHAALARHGIRRLRIDAALSIDALHGFFELIALAPRGEPDPRELIRMLGARDARGLRLNDLESSFDAPAISLAATPPCPSVSLTTTRLGDLAQIDDETTQPIVPAPTTAPAEGDPEPRVDRLRARLVELEHSFDDESYARRAQAISRWAREVWDAGLHDAFYTVVCALADHAVGGGGRTERQAAIALTCFAALTDAERLEHLIDRALASDDGGVRAAQLLLQRREAAVPRILERIQGAADPFAPSVLHALLLTCGEASVPALQAEIEGRDDDRARVALRLAGELQSPALLPVLARTAKRAPLARQIEAIRALCLLPGEASLQALAEALTNQLDQIALAATEAIAAKAGIDPVPALLDVLESHLRGSRTKLCCALVDVLARLGDERAVPRLAALLERRPVLRRAHWHSIQLAAVDALAVLPTREARRALEKAASQAAAPIRDRARAQLSAQTAVTPPDDPERPSPRR